jgi:DNA-binding CsgD family transcriptional regulator
VPGDADLFEPWPFTGRRAEVGAALAAWQVGRGVVLTGAHGSGRTRLAERVVARAGGSLIAADEWTPSRGQVAIDDAEQMTPAARRAALGQGCLVVLPAWLEPDGGDVVALAPLDAAAVSTVLHRVLGQPVGAGAVARLALASRGNLRSLVELARGSRDAGILALEGGSWQLAGEPRPTRLVVERVEHVLASLTPAQREGVELVALGEPLPRGWLARARGEVLDAVLACPLVCGQDSLQLRDEVARDLVLASMPGLRARRLARLLLDAPIGDPAARALWAETAGDQPAPQGALAAAAHLLARGRADRAAALLERTGPTPAVVLARAALLVHAGRPDEVPGQGPSHRLAAAAAQVGGLGMPSVRTGPMQAWPAPGADWDPFPSAEVVDAVLAARTGELGRATTAARRALATAGSGWAPDLAWASLALGWVALAAGQPLTAQRRGLDLAAAAEQLRWPAMAAVGRNLAAVAASWTGTPAAPWSDGAEPADSVLADWSRSWRARAHAWSSAGSGRADVEGMLALGHAACDRGDLVTALELGSDVRRLGAPGPARELLARCRSGPAPVRAELDAAEAALADDAGLWLRAAEAFRASGARAHAAECLVQGATAMGSARGATVRVRADELLAECEGLRTPLASATHAALTSREREVAVMAADGEASRHIAERLGISVRTVDNLLARCYVKLGVSGRRDLAAALGLVGGVR